jgi:hypothetical protein
VSDNAPGRWLIWGTQTSDHSSTLINDEFFSAVVSELETRWGPAETVLVTDECCPDGGSEQPEPEQDDAEHIALIHQLDPDWTPPDETNSSWMSVVQDTTEDEIRAMVDSFGARGYRRL